MHVCPLVSALVPHVGGPILAPGAVTALIGGLPAARVGDMCVCIGPPDVVALGSFTVLLSGLAAARMGDITVAWRDDRAWIADGADWLNG
jgi:uncharacterized Zn-binding protein involved in type VI secretion